MNDMEHAAARVSQARKLGRPPVKWIADEAHRREARRERRVARLAGRVRRNALGIGPDMPPAGMSDSVDGIARDLIAEIGWLPAVGYMLGRLGREVRLLLAVVVSR